MHREKRGRPGVDRSEAILSGAELRQEGLRALSRIIARLEAGRTERETRSGDGGAGADYRRHRAPTANKGVKTEAEPAPGADAASNESVFQGGG